VKHQVPRKMLILNLKREHRKMMKVTRGNDQHNFQSKKGTLKRIRIYDAWTIKKKKNKAHVGTYSINSIRSHILRK
jgi:hypothetical protein